MARQPLEPGRAPTRSLPSRKKLTELASRVDAAPCEEGRRRPAGGRRHLIGRRRAYILRFPEEFAKPEYVAHTMSVLDTGLTRAKELEAGAPSWTKRKGHVVRAYVSRVDGSVQPCGLTIPASYDGSRPMRLDIWQHGTDRTLNEVAFIMQQERDRPIPADQDYIQLEPLGRTNLSYRWAGGVGSVRVARLRAAALQHRSPPHRSPRILDGRRQLVAPGSAPSGAMGGD